MLDKFEAVNVQDDLGNPSGGSVKGTGLEIHWQDGPLGRGKMRKDPNGAFVETVVAAAIQRIRFYQEANKGKFACRENSLAITHFETGLLWLQKRTQDREARNVEGTHTP